jgi:O-antigen/teichoic acid export membrane protein
MTLFTAIRSSALGKRAHRLGANRAVAFSMAGQAWSALAGPLTMLVIAHGFSPVEQGFYYTFNSALALQVFVELGLATVLVQSASHEWAHLGLDARGMVTGPAHQRSRLASLLRFAWLWYFVSGVVVAVGLGVGGYTFFSVTSQPDVAWEMPWILLCAVTGLNLMTTPLLAIVEGCNQVTSVYLFRLLQGISTSLAVMAAILAGAGLYAPVVGALVRLAGVIAYFGLKQRRFVGSLLAEQIEAVIEWRREIWPFQWRIGVSWLSGYIIFSLFTPVMFMYHGAVVAGQMGMTWALVTAIESFSYPWLNTRMPQFGMLIAKRQYAELDALFRQLALATLALAAVGGVGLWLVLMLVHVSNNELGTRVLPLLPASLLILHRTLNVVVSVLALYMRAHKQEPMMIPSLVSALLTGAATLTLGIKYGPLGAAAGILGVLLLWGLPATVITYRRFFAARLLSQI